MEQKFNIDGIKKAMKHAPKTINPKAVLVNTCAVAYTFSDEYEQEMKKNHTDLAPKKED